MESLVYYFGRWTLAGSFSINENMISTGVKRPCDTKYTGLWEPSHIVRALIDACLYVWT